MEIYFDTRIDYRFCRVFLEFIGFCESAQRLGGFKMTDEIFYGDVFSCFLRHNCNWLFLEKAAIDVNVIASMVKS